MNRIRIAKMVSTKSVGKPGWTMQNEVMKMSEDMRSSSMENRGEFSGWDLRDLDNGDSTPNGTTRRFPQLTYLLCALALLMQAGFCKMVFANEFGQTFPCYPMPHQAGNSRDSKSTGENSETALETDWMNCSSQNYAGPLQFFWPLPQGFTQALAMRFEAAVGDSLKEVSFFVFDPGDGSFGNDSLFIRLYSDVAGLPGALLDARTVPSGTFPAYPIRLIVSYGGGLVTNGPFHVGISTSAAIGSGRYESILSDSGSTGTARSSYFYQGSWYSVPALTGLDFNYDISTLICHPTCYASGDANGDASSLTVADLAYLRKFIFSFGDAPAQLSQVDLNGDCVVDSLDVQVYQDYFNVGMSAFAPYGGYPVATCCSPQVDILTVGEHHNRALDYLMVHNPLTGNEKRVTKADYYNILDTILSYGVQTGFDWDDFNSGISMHKQGLDSLGMFYEDENTEYFGAPTVTDSVLPYVVEYYHQGGLIGDTARVGLLTFNQMFISGIPTSTIVDYAANILPLMYETPSDSLMLSAASDVFLNSNTYWNTSRATPGSIALADAEGAIYAYEACGYAMQLVCPECVVAAMVAGAATFSLIEANSIIAQPSDSINYHGLRHHALENTFLDLANGNLEFGPLTGDSAGIAVDLGPAIRWNIAWVPLDPGGVLPDSASVATTAIGQVNGIPDQPIATTLVRKIGSEYELSADFSPVGATSIKVLIYNDNILVDSVTGITTIKFATLNGCVDDDHFGNPTDGFPWGGALTLIDPREIVFPFKDNKAIVGDEFWMIPENPTLSYEFPSRIELKTFKIPVVSVNSESSTAPFVPGDADGNGIITISDAVFLIQYIFAGGPSPNPPSSGDADCSGVITISDVVYLINYIFAGGPAPCGTISPGLQGNLDSQGLNRINCKEVNLGLSKISADYGVACIDANTDVDLAGVQLEFAMNSDQTGQISVHKTSRSNGMQIFSGYVDGLYKVGIVDLSGKNVIAAGEGPIAAFDFNDAAMSLYLNNAIVCDRQARELSVTIDRAEKTSSLPTQFELDQNYPNPFNPSTEISFSLPTAGEVRLDVLNLLGQTVKNLSSKLYAAGNHQVTWDGTNSKGEPVASGIYFYRLNAGDFSTSKKMMLLK